jgi:hypothetical protein
MKEEKIDLTVLESSKTYFSEIITEAFERRKFKTSPIIATYLVDLLDMYIISENSKMNVTFAEQLLRAANADRACRVEILRRLGDTSLYVSGVFGDSLRHKIVDVDYYAEIGGLAYGHLATEMKDESLGIVFREFSERFLDYVDVLTIVGQSTGLQSNQDLLRLYERYIATGSPLAKGQLEEKGLLTNVDKKKVAQ